MRTNRTRKASATAYMQLQDALGFARCSSLGDFERLAGIDTENERERAKLWNQFRHLFCLRDPQPLFDAVTEHCSAIALERVTRGELSLLWRELPRH